MGKIYELIKAERLPAGIIRHQVEILGKAEEFKYRSVRIGLVWPTVENPGYYVVGDMEVDDRFAPDEKGVIRIIEEEEVNDLSLIALFESVTTAYVTMMADALYCDFSLEDHRIRFWEYLDRCNLRGISCEDIAYRDLVLRFSAIKDFNDAGSLILDKGSDLFKDLQGISREHLKNKPEAAFYRLNALSYLVSGFLKFPPKQMLSFKFEGGRDNNSWML